MPFLLKSVNRTVGNHAVNAIVTEGMWKGAGPVEKPAFGASVIEPRVKADF